MIAMSFFFAMFYLVAEYMRPQQMYPFLENMPFGQIAVIGMLAAFAIERRGFDNNQSLNGILVSYLFIFFLAFLTAVNPDAAAQPVVDFAKWVVIYFLLINVLDDKKKLYAFVILFLLLNAKYALFAVRVWAAKGFYSDPRGLNEGAGIGTSFFRNPNDFGAALNAVIGISIYMLLYDVKKAFNFFRMRWLHIVCVIILPLAVLASSSRGAAFALGVSAFAVLLKSRKKTAAFTVLAIAVVVFIKLIPEDNMERFRSIGTEYDSTGQTRMELWKAGIKMANENPFTGVGPNNYVYVNQYVYKNGLDLVQHNIYVQAASELGYPGLITFLMMVGWCFIYQRKVRRILKAKGLERSYLYGLSHGLDVSLIGFLVNGMFITVLYYPFFWTLLVLNASLYRVALNSSAEKVIGAQPLAGQAALALEKGE